MGVGSSSEVVSHHVLQRLCGERSVPLSDALWTRLLDNGFEGEPEAMEPDQLVQVTRTYCDQLARNNAGSHNLHRLVLHTIMLLHATAAEASSSQPPERTLHRCVHALLWMQLFARHCTETGVMDAQWSPHWVADDAEWHANQGQGSSPHTLLVTGVPLHAEAVREAATSLPVALCRALVNVLCWSHAASHTEALTEPVYELHLQAVRLLQILCSAQLYGLSVRTPHLFFDLLMSRAQELSATRLVQRLLHHVVLQRSRQPRTAAESWSPDQVATLPASAAAASPPAHVDDATPALASELLGDDTDDDDDDGGAPSGPGSSGVVGEAGSLLLSLAVRASSLAWAPFRVLIGVATRTASAPKAVTPLAEACLALLLTLTSAGHNVYTEALNGAQDVIALPGQDVDSASFTVSFSHLYKAFCDTVNTDLGVLLFYMLFQGNAAWRAYALSRTDLDLLLVPMLHRLYTLTGANDHHQPNEGTRSQHVYIVLINLLMFSEDAAWNACVHRLTLASVPWFVEQRLVDASLGDLIVLVVVRTVQRNLCQLRDSYLHTSSLAILANMASSFERLHPYAATRLVRLFEVIAKRHRTVSKRLITEREAGSGATTVSMSAANQGTTGAGDGVGDGDDDDGLSPVMLYEEFMHIVLRVLHACLANALPQNPNLVYSLLYRRTLFEPLCEHPVFAFLVAQMQVIIHHFGRLLDQIPDDGARTVEQVMAVVHEGIRSWNSDALAAPEPLFYRYTPEEDPQEFFTPYVWTLIVERWPAMCFNVAAVRLIDVADMVFPHTAGAGEALRDVVHAREAVPRDGAAKDAAVVDTRLDRVSDVNTVGSPVVTYTVPNHHLPQSPEPVVVTLTGGKGKAYVDGDL